MTDEDEPRPQRQRPQPLHKDEYRPSVGERIKSSVMGSGRIIALGVVGVLSAVAIPAALQHSRYNDQIDSLDAAYGKEQNGVPTDFGRRMKGFFGDDIMRLESRPTFHRGEIFASLNTLTIKTDRDIFISRIVDLTNLWDQIRDDLIFSVSTEGNAEKISTVTLPREDMKKLEHQVKLLNDSYKSEKPMTVEFLLTRSGSNYSYLIGDGLTQLVGDLYCYPELRGDRGCGDTSESSAPLVPNGAGIRFSSPAQSLPALTRSLN